VAKARQPAALIGGALLAAGLSATAAGAEQDWTAVLPDLLPGVRACIAASEKPVARVSVARPMNHGLAFVRLVDIGGARADCRVDLGSGTVESIDPVEGDAMLPGEDAPAFIPAAPAPGWSLVPVTGDQDRPLGWLLRPPPAEKAAVPPDVGLVGPTWALQDMGGSGVLAGVPSLLTFDAGGGVHGNGGCNGFAGQAAIAGDSLRFGPLRATRKACAPAEIMDQENGFLRALDTVRSWQIEDGLLRLLDAEGRPVLRLAPTADR